jgi:alpha-1,6-mannosyltransferase
VGRCAIHWIVTILAVDTPHVHVADDRAAVTQHTGHGVSGRTAGLRLGLAGSVLAAVGAFGAGATLVHDPVLSGTPLDGWRHGSGRAVATIVLYLGVMMMTAAWVRLGLAARAGHADTRRVRRAIGIWAVPLLLAPPLFSTDLYTYLAQGAVAHAGLNPYHHVPAELPGPITENATGGWLSIPSPYGPLFIFLVKNAVAVAGDHLILASLSTRLAISVGLLLLGHAIPALCRCLGARPECALWLGAANPLVLLQLLSGAHNDLLMDGLLVMGTVLVLRRCPVRGFTLVTMAAAVKAPAAVALPFLVWVWAAHRSHGNHPTWRSLVHTAAAGGCIVVGVFGGCTLLAGVDFGWITTMDANSGLEPWLSLPTALGRISAAALNLFTRVAVTTPVADLRTAGFGLLAVVLLWLWWRARPGGPVAVRYAALALLAMALLAPVTFPWYFTWALSLGVASRWPARWVGVAAAASVYLTFSTHPDGATLLPHWAFATVLAASVAVGVVMGRRGTAASRLEGSVAHA